MQFDYFVKLKHGFWANLPQANYGFYKKRWLKHNLSTKFVDQKQLKNHTPERTTTNDPVHQKIPRRTGTGEKEHR